MTVERGKILQITMEAGWLELEQPPLKHILSLLGGMHMDMRTE